MEAESENRVLLRLRLRQTAVGAGMGPGAQPAEPGRRLPSWVWSRSAGILIGVLGVAAATVIIWLFDRYVTNVPNPSLPYTVLILVVAFGWGGRAGFGTALAAFVAVLYFFTPQQSKP